MFSVANYCRRVALPGGYSCCFNSSSQIANHMELRWGWWPPKQTGSFGVQWRIFGQTLTNPFADLGSKKTSYISYSLLHYCVIMPSVPSIFRVAPNIPGTNVNWVRKCVGSITHVPFCYGVITCKRLEQP